MQEGAHVFGCVHDNFNGTDVSVRSEGMKVGAADCIDERFGRLKRHWLVDDGWEGGRLRFVKDEASDVVDKPESVIVDGVGGGRGQKGAFDNEPYLKTRLAAARRIRL